MEDTNNNEVTKIDHQDAVQMQASSRYLLGDLSAAESAAFEEHYFNCAECAEDLVAGSLLASEVRAVCGEDTKSVPGPVSSIKKSWWGRIPSGFVWPLATACACLLLGISFTQNQGLRKQVAELSEPHQPMAVTLKIARGPETFFIPKENMFWEAHFRLPVLETPSYLCDIERNGAVIKRISLAAPANGQPFIIHLRRSDFPTGTYIFKVHGPNTKAVQYTLDINTD